MQNKKAKTEQKGGEHEVGRLTRDYKCQEEATRMEKIVREALQKFPCVESHERICRKGPGVRTQPVPISPDMCLYGTNMEILFAAEPSL